MNWKVFKKMTFKQKLFAIFIFTPMFYIFVGIAKVLANRIEERKKYKKVVKKGLFWDTEYLIEKE
jgi:hypothetical protein